MDALIGLNGTGVVSVASGGVDLVDSVNGIFPINDATVTDLGSFAEIIAAIGTLANVGAGDKAIFTVQDSAGVLTGVYAFTDNNADTMVDASELALLAIVDTPITDTDAAVV